MRSIGTRLASQIAVLFVVVLTGFGALILYQQQQYLTEQVYAKEERTVEQIGLIVSKLLFEVNLADIENVLRSYLTDQDVVAIKVFESETPWMHLGKQPASAEVLDLGVDTPISGDVAGNFPRETDLRYEEVKIGHVEIVFSRQWLTTYMRRALFEFSLGGSVIIFIAVGMVVGLMRNGVKIPLLHLVTAAQHIANGEVQIDLPPNAGRGEIRVLAVAFGKMITYMQGMAQTAETISRGDLRQEIQPLATHDVLGHAFLNMTTYLNRMAVIAEMIAAGDLRQEIQPQSEDDVLGRAFQKMEQLRRSMQDILQATLKLQDGSRHLNHISAAMLDSVHETSLQTSIVSSSSQQMNHHIESVAESSRELTANIGEIAGDTAKIVQITHAAVEKARLANRTMLELTTRTQKIEDVIKVITAITQQTNLLALNATIEAARAGEAGKGFSVVAHEIKDLSRETAASAQDIIRNLEAIWQISQQATAANNEVMTIITQIRDLSSSIAGGTEQQSQTTAGISHRVTEIAAGSRQIMAAVSQVAQAAEQTSGSAESVETAAGELATLAEAVRALVTRFKI